MLFKLRHYFTKSTPGRLSAILPLVNFAALITYLPARLNARPLNVAARTSVGNPIYDVANAIPEDVAPITPQMQPEAKRSFEIGLYDK